MGHGFFYTNPGLPTNPAAIFRFGSRHSGIVNFASCDGAVRALRSPILSPGAQYDAFLAMTGFRDGRAFDASQIAN